MPGESEWLTRKQRIDARLNKLGWTVMPCSGAHDAASLDGIAVEEWPTANGPADYGLFVEGRLLGIIEAKKVTVNPQNVLEQAKRYAAGVFNAAGEWNGLRVPFLYASNGTLTEFEAAYGKDTNGLSKRSDAGDTGRFRRFSLGDIKERGYKLDVTWLRDESLEDSDELPEPQDLAGEAITELEAVVDDLRDIVALLEKEEGIEK